MIQQSPIKIWRKFNNRYRLLGNECVDCNNRHYPPVQVCKKCHGTNLVAYQYPNTGRLVSWSKVTAVSKGFESYAPYIIAIVELEDLGLCIKEVIFQGQAVILKSANPKYDPIILIDKPARIIGKVIMHVGYH